MKGIFGILSHYTICGKDFKWVNLSMGKNQVEALHKERTGFFRGGFGYRLKLDTKVCSRVFWERKIQAKSLENRRF